MFRNLAHKAAFTTPSQEPPLSHFNNSPEKNVHDVRLSCAYLILHLNALPTNLINTHPPRPSHPTFLFLTLMSLVNPNISKMWQDGTRHPNPISTNTLLLKIAHKQFTYKCN